MKTIYVSNITLRKISVFSYIYCDSCYTCFCFVLIFRRIKKKNMTKKIQFGFTFPHNERGRKGCNNFKYKGRVLEEEEEY